MKTKKKLFFLVAACAAAATAAVAFTACENKEHTHDWGEWEVVTPATCTEDGLETHSCKDDASHKENRVIQAKGHGTPAKVDAQPASCTATGTAEYWACPDCGQKFSDAAGTTAITAPAVIPAAHGTLTKTDEDAATCTENGTQAYWTCGDCGQKFSDEDGTTPISTPVVIPAGHGTPVKIDEKPATCTENGAAEHWACPDCGQKFSDAAGTTQIAAPTVIPMAHGEIYHSAATTATCARQGVQEYWMCLVCNQKFSDADATQELDDADLQTTPIVPTAHSPLEHRVRIEATCTSAGTKEHWYCPGCLNLYSDAAGEHKISKAQTIPATHGNLEKTEKVEATCAREGAEAYWTCDRCSQKFSDANGVNKIPLPVAIKKVKHTVVSVAANTENASITLPNGNSLSHDSAAYYKCSVCNKKFAEQACTHEITNTATIANRKNVILEEKNNVMYSTVQIRYFISYFKAETAGCYVFIFDDVTLGAVSYTSLSTEANPVSVYNPSWQTESIYIKNFGKNNKYAKIANIVYVDMKANDVVNFNGTLSANKLCSVNIMKVNIDNADNNLLLGDNEVTVTESEAENGVLWKFTAPEEDFYEITVPEECAAYVMKFIDENKTGILSPGEDKLSFKFKAAKNEKVEFYMSVDTMGDDVTFPATYTVTVTKGVEFPEVVIGNDYKIITLSSGYSEYEFIVNAAATGDYVVQIIPYPATSRNYYDLYVNGAEIGPMQATNDDGGVWKMEVQLGEGMNTLNLKNHVPQNSSGDVRISIVPKAQ